MIYLGIDIAKNTHAAVALSSDGEVVIQPFVFPNNAQGFATLGEKLSSLPEPPLIGLESTAHYGANLIQYLQSGGHRVVMLNPLQTAALRKSAIRKTKTDKTDSFIIAKTLMMDSFREIEPLDAQLVLLRGLCNCRQNLIHLRTRAKIQMGALVDQLFPELNGFFKSGLHINTSYALLKKHPCPSEIKSLHLTSLTNLLLKASKGKYTQTDAIKLRELAAVSVGVDDPIIALQIQLAIAQIELYTSQLLEVHSRITAIMNSLNSPIMTIPGISHLNAAMILSCIGDIHRFASSAKLLAFAGLDPAVYQSGNFQAKSARMSKRGNSMLRYALIYASHNVARNNDTFGKYYASKIAQGKSHYCALGHTAHKLVRVIHTLLSRGIAFDLD